MKITCDKLQLQNALGLVIRAVSTRTTMPILECILLKANNDEGLTLYASDLEISISTSPMPAEVDESGSIALNAKLLSEIVKKMTGDFITIETDDKFNATIKSGNSRLKIVGQLADEFPAIPENELNNEANGKYAIKPQTLKDMIRKTIFSVSVDPSNLVLNGELLEIKENTLHVVAVDMFRISYRAEKLENEQSEDGRAVIPTKALNELSRILPSSDNNVLFYYTDKRAIFETNEFILTSRILEGNFVRYEQIFNDNFNTMVTCNRLSLLNAFERVILVAMENRMLPITLGVNNNEITITANTERGQADDNVSCEVDGNELTIYFNPRYFIEALRVIDEENISLKFNNQLSPCTIRGIESKVDAKYLIVPLRPPS